MVAVGLFAALVCTAMGNIPAALSFVFWAAVAYHVRETRR